MPLPQRPAARRGPSRAEASDRRRPQGAGAWLALRAACAAGSGACHPLSVAATGSGRMGDAIGDGTVSGTRAFMRRKAGTKEHAVLVGVHLRGRKVNPYGRETREEGKERHADDR